jgi:hypothetical protein
MRQLWLTYTSRSQGGGCQVLKRADGLGVLYFGDRVLESHGIDYFSGDMIETTI